MKASELKVGSTYLSTKFRTPVICEMADMWEIYARAEGATPGENEIDSVFEPIPLTEEWLIKFGAEKSNDEYGGFFLPKHNGTRLRIKYAERYIGESKVKCWSIFFGIGRYGGFYVQADHVHQLQNLYFALTGEELTIKQ